MKRTILTFGLIAFLGLTATSCSTDDSTLDSKQTAADNTLGNGDRELPKPTPPKL